MLILCAVIFDKDLFITWALFFVMYVIGFVVGRLSKIYEYRKELREEERD